MKIDLKKTIKTPTGEEVKGMTLSKELANGLAQQIDSTNPLKVWEWCQKLATVGYLDLDTEDLGLFKESIKKAKGFSVMFLGQVLQEIAKQSG